jgi:hypothetical protein
MASSRKKKLIFTSVEKGNLMQVLSYGDDTKPTWRLSVCDITVDECTRVIIELPTIGGARRFSLPLVKVVACS